ncbi:MAG: outer membrane protein OmpA-like peptidoglycan-associated protein [Cellvibrionaceae bacterium]|jgi:outer membrane protein OmpA-like peptidoglycan-associated protein
MNIVKSIIVVVSALGVLAGCTTQDAYTGDSKINRATAYGVIGAVVCGAIGSRESSKRARNAAAACGLAGAGVGAYMDAQEKQLRAELVGSGVQVVRYGDNLRLVMPNSITFGVNQATLSTSIYGTLNAVVKVLNEFNETRLQVAGHTDSSGEANYNQELSVRRANSVGDYFQSQKVSASRLVTVGYGESRPIANNSSQAGRADNRRVELLIQPKS